MAIESTGEPLIDAALDRAIEQALAAEPSPAFVARVRLAIASEPPPASGCLGWRPGTRAIVAITGAAALVAAIAIGAALSRRPPATRSAESSPLTARATATAAALLSGRASRPLTISTAPRRVRHADPEVLISTAEREALSNVIAEVNQGRFDMAAVVQAARPDVMNLPPISPIAIAPIDIEPLAPAGRDEGVHQ
jgi:hypothetical protein